eukprot:2782923-Prymnesium_polylepis.1
MLHIYVLARREVGGGQRTPFSAPVFSQRQRHGLRGPWSDCRATPLCVLRGMHIKNPSPPYSSILPPYRKSISSAPIAHI